MVRLPWSLFLATLIWYAVVLGFRCTGGGRGLSGQDALMSGLSLLFGVLVTQVPLDRQPLVSLAPGGGRGRAVGRRE